jgi:DNA-directed RNA polymerase subunit beta'
VVELTAKVSVRLTEWTKDKASGELVPHLAGGHHRGPRPAVRDPAQGPAVSLMNKALKKKEISLINASFRKCGLKDTVVFADKLLQNGFRLATRAGISIAIDDMLVPREKPAIIERAERRSRRSSSSTSRVW